MPQIILKKIHQLQGLQFFIPAYQRGYRWTRQEVSDLLNDIYENNREAQYCLQTLIVKKRQDGSYEVVDGQQRLTTIFIFMQIVIGDITSATQLFSLEYETRERSKNFLNDLSVNSPRDDSNIDFHHISAARDEINKWLHEQPDRSVAVSRLNEKLRLYTQFIWYEIDENTNLIDLFRKVNMGKIPLTNAELVKALFISRDNFTGMAPDEVDKRQTEIAMQWELMEQKLQNDSFWHFLTTKEGKETRIDLIFDILAERYDPQQEIIGKQRTFLVLHKRMKEMGPIAFIEDIWKEAELLLAVFTNWYNDLDVYHRIGWLVQANFKVKDLENDLRGKKKSKVVDSLDEKIKNELKLRREEIAPDTPAEQLKYGNNKERERIRRLLLLFNLVSLRESGNRFPFSRYVSETWDIEHIHAIKDKLPEEKKDKRSYFEALLKEFVGHDSKKLGDAIRAFLDGHNGDEEDNADDYDKKYEEWLGTYAELLFEDNTIGNLTLLNSDINRGYKNDTFFQKRQTILNEVKNGRFIPVGTQNVFLKLYTDKAQDLHRWTTDDRNKYCEAMIDVLKPYITN